MHHSLRFTPLHMAVSKNNFVLVKELCTRENVNDTAGNIYFTPLHSAALKGVDLEIIAYLLNMEININAKDVHGDSALFIAASAGKQKVVEFLIFKGAEIDQDRLKSSTAYLERRYPQILSILQNPDRFTQQSRYSWPKNVSTSIKQRTSRRHDEAIIEMVEMVSSLK